MRSSAASSLTQAGTTEDGRREVRVFMASSDELVDERRAFPSDVAAIQRRPDVERSYRLTPVRWQTDAFGGRYRDINATIRESVDFETLDVVVVVVWNRIGRGTLDEYRRARDLYQLHGKPRLLLYMRHPGAGTDQQALEELQVFKAAAIRAGIVPNEYDTASQLSTRLVEHLPRVLPRPTVREATESTTLRRRFMAFGLAGLVLSILAVASSRLMAMPSHNVSLAYIFSILGAPPLLALTSMVATVSYHRLLGALRRDWHSPEYTDERILESYRDLVPRIALPPRLRRRFPEGVASTLGTGLLLGLVFLSPVVAVYHCVFDEMLAWEYTVGHDYHMHSNGVAVSDYVDRDRPWFHFGLHDPEVRAVCQARPDCIVYVHAQGQFEASRDEPFRANLGPEVFLPWQPGIYCAIMMAMIAASLYTARRLAYFSTELV